MGSTASADIEWPPKSPHDVLLSTPTGRKRLRRLEERLLPSPSPLKSSMSAPSFQTKGAGQSLPKLDLDDDDDEETLELQLQEIQAKLRLKKLQKSKSKAADSGSDAEHSLQSGASQISRAHSVAGTRSQQSWIDD